MFSFDPLRCFVAVAEERHFGRAAERLQMTQPPLSRQIQKLERGVGAVLFIRGSRSVVLSPAGEAFLVEARRLLGAAQSARASALRIATGSAGTLTVGFTAMSSVGLLPALLREADETLPDVDIRLDELVSSAQFDALDTGELDLGLVRQAPASVTITSRVVQRERLVVALPATHELSASGKPLSVADFEDVDMIGYTEAGAGYLSALVSSVLVNTPVRSRQLVTQVHTALALVGVGRGVSLVPESAAAFGLDGVVFRDVVEWREPVVELRAAWRPDSPNPALHRALAEFATLRGHR